MNIPIRFAQSAARLPGASGAEAVTFGVPLPRGAVRSADCWSLVPDGGRPCPTDVRVLEAWPDGSIRWALVDAQLEFPGALVSGVIETDGAVPSPAGPSIAITERAADVEVSTGAAVFVFVPGGRTPFEQVIVGGAPMLAAHGGGLTVVAEDGVSVDVRVDRCTVEHRGRLRAVVRLDGVAAVGRRSVQVTTRVECLAGLNVARVICTLRNPDAARHPGNFWDLGDEGSVLLKDVAVTLQLASPAPESLMVSAEPGQPAVGYPRPFELYQDSSGGEAWKSTNHINRRRDIPTTFRGYRIDGGAPAAGLRATPVVAVTGLHTGLGLAVPEFWQNFPQAIEVRDAAVVLRMFPGRFADLHELQGGEQKTHEWDAAFGPRVTVDDLDWCRAGTLVAADPEWVLASGALDFVGRFDAEHAALVNAAIEGPDRFEAKREVIDQYGWRHFGEIYGDHEAIRHPGPAPLVSHYNNQYDPVAGFALQFVRTGDPRWWRAMSELARHVIDIDIYHTTRDKSAYNGGLFWHTYHYGDVDTATHRTYPARGKGKTFGGGPSADHNYPTGLMLYYFLTGREAAREAAIGLAEYVINLDNGRVSRFRWLSHADTGGAIATAPAFFGPARASGNSLNALVDGHRLTGDVRFLRKAERLVRRVVHPEDVIAKNQLDEPEIRWFYVMFLQALGKYLHHRAERGLVDAEYAYGRAALLHYARWMADHEYPYLDRPEKLEFPTETWAAQDIRKSDIFYVAAMHTDGEERARFEERGRFFHQNAVDTLSAMPTRTLARPVIVMLTSGFMDGWFRARPAPSEPRPASSPTFGSPATFVPQRAIAMRRAKILAAAVAVSGLAALVALVTWLGR